MFSKDDINKAIEIVKEDIAYLKTTSPRATVEIDALELTVHCLERCRDRKETLSRFIESQKQNELARCELFGRRL